MRLQQEQRETERGCAGLRHYRLLVLVLVSLAANFVANGAKKDPWEMRAIWLTVFAYLSEWPAEIVPKPDAPLKIGVLGEGAESAQIVRWLHEELDHPDPLLLKVSKVSKNRNIKVVKCSNAEEAELCQIVYITHSEKDHWPQLLRNLQNKSLITVGDTEEFARLGGVINFEESERNVLGFAINRKQFRRLLDGNVKISDYVLDFVTAGPK